MGQPEEYHSPIFEEILKSIPLYTRLKVPLEMAYLNLTIQPDRCCTDEEANAACKWAEELATHLIEEIAQWEKDGRPQERIPDDKQSEEDPSPIP